MSGHERVTTVVPIALRPHLQIAGHRDRDAIRSAVPGSAQDVPARAGVTAFSALDFRVGDRDVFVRTKVGTNHIAKVLDDCAVTGTWHDAAGIGGGSLFDVRVREPVVRLSTG